MTHPRQYGPRCTLTNKQTWENLDKRDREAIQRAAITTEKALGKALDNNLISMVKTLEQEGAQVRYLKKSELDAWQKAIGYQQEQTQWVEKQNNEGVEKAGEVMQKLPIYLMKQCVKLVVRP
ncbi:hypothetical protein [Escherichia fergusonii]|uniref:hypothetical protein n=1 Tax=Escherichia fergusonii TaxID=564 RepID=UPI0022B462D1|nr:hypothetical protein [Escherichia fergusonii]MCZ5215157.1 hypothetical protein [Escherichia fergusonii]